MKIPPPSAPRSAIQARSELIGTLLRQAYRRYCPGRLTRAALRAAGEAALLPRRQRRVAPAW